ncbi:J domain-containing protein [Natrinema caseinilyticum]|uniref:J domain-containing protein n=1 Tax=Natrinema caseinilyticum TaxID=2961570 RepID=UPI0020C4DB10|nr:J domain-containing protein [Natrinema caseinilyticum]
MTSHYEALGLTPDADEQAVRRAYRVLLKDHHPDHGGSREQFLRIKEAYEHILGERAPNDRETDGGTRSEGGRGLETHGRASGGAITRDGYDPYDDVHPARPRRGRGDRFGHRAAPLRAETAGSRAARPIPVRAGVSAVGPDPVVVGRSRGAASHRLGAEQQA